MVSIPPLDDRRATFIRPLPDEAALRHGASVEEDVQDADVADARVPPSEPTRYRDGWLPD
jgi:hypothetical protein